MDLTANFSGWTELGQALERLPEEIQKVFAGEALQDGADIVYAAVVRNIPVGKPRANAPHPSPYMASALKVGKPTRKRSVSQFTSIDVSYDTKKFPKLVTYKKGGKVRTDLHPALAAALKRKGEAPVIEEGKRYFYPAVIEYGSKYVVAQAPMRKGFFASYPAALDAIFAKLASLVTRHFRKAA